MNRYTIRVDVVPDRVGLSIDEIKQRVIKVLNDPKLNTQKYIIAYETKTKSQVKHYQGIIYTDMNHNTYKKLMSGTYFPEWKGKRGENLTSFAEVSKDTYEVYVTKENILFFKGYTDDELVELTRKSYTKTPSRPQRLASERTYPSIAPELAERKTILKQMIKDMSHAQREYFGQSAGLCCIFIQNWYLRNFDKYPQDHYLRCLTKGLYVMLGVHERQLRMARIAAEIVREFEAFDPETLSVTQGPTTIYPHGELNNYLDKIDPDSEEIFSDNNINEILQKENINT